MRQSAAKSQPQTHNTCIRCDSIKPLQDFIKDRKTKLGVRNTCLECIRKKYYENPDYRKERNERVARFRKTERGGIMQRMMACKRRAKESGLPFDLDIGFLVELYKEQGGFCALSGRKMTVPVGEGDWWDKASIDKIEPAKGYVKGNVQFLIMQVNNAKNNMDNVEFLEMCREIVEKGSTTIPSGSTPKQVEAPNNT